MSLTLRQLRQTLSGPIYWIINGSAVLLAALAGPYFTLERLSFPERLVYWGTALLLSGAIMTFLSIYAHRLTEHRGWNWAGVAILAGIVGVVPVVMSLYLAEGLATGFAPGWIHWLPLSKIALNVAPPLIAVTLVVNLAIELQDRKAALQAPAQPEPQVPNFGPITALQKKLPHHLGHDIVTVRAQDHYVEVTTPKGSAMILTRLSDAEEQLAPLGGLRVHRSWWVNTAHIKRTEQGANGPEVVMSTDQRIPVGRSYRAAFREAVQG